MTDGGGPVTAGSTGAAGQPSIVGSYRVESVERTLDDGTVTEPFGPDPVGLLIYGADGMTTAIVGASGRPLLDLDLIANRVTASDADQAAAFRSAHGFAGSYEVTDGAVVHRIQVSTVENWVGTEQVRPYTLDGDILTLRPPGWKLTARRTGLPASTAP